MKLFKTIFAVCLAAVTFNSCSDDIYPDFEITNFWRSTIQLNNGNTAYFLPTLYFNTLPSKQEWDPETILFAHDGRLLSGALTTQDIFWETNNTISLSNPNVATALSDLSGSYNLSVKSTKGKTASWSYDLDYEDARMGVMNIKSSTYDGTKLTIVLEMVSADNPADDQYVDIATGFGLYFVNSVWSANSFIYRTALANVTVARSVNQVTLTGTLNSTNLGENESVQVFPAAFYEKVSGTILEISLMLPGDRRTIEYGTTW